MEEKFFIHIEGILRKNCKTNSINELFAVKYSLMKEYILKLWDSGEIPAEAKLLTRITSIRWIGWGFAESLIPVFLYSFGHSYADAGLLRSAYDIAFIIALPLVGVFADQMRATTLVLIGLFLYLFCGASYFFAGMTGFAIFVVLARALNGVAFSLDVVGRNTCIRRHTPSSKLATVFGYFDMVANFWWMVAACIGIFLIKYFSIPNLLLMIVPATLISIIILVRFRNKKTEHTHGIHREVVPLSSILKEVTFWDSKLKSLLLFNFFIAFTGAIIGFFLPIQAYINGNGYDSVILMGIIIVLPTIFSWRLGKLFDGKGIQIFTKSLIAFTALVFSLAFFQTYIWQVVVLFLVSLIVELLSLGTNEMMAVYAKPEHFGRVDGIMRSVADIGSMIGPLMIGIVMDSYGVPVAYTLLGVIISAVTIVFYLTIQKSKK